MVQVTYVVFPKLSDFKENGVIYIYIISFFEGLLQILSILELFIMPLYVQNLL